MNRKRFIEDYSTKLYKEICFDLNDKYKNDPQFLNLIYGIALLNASTKYDLDFQLIDCLENLRYNLNYDLLIPAKGLISVNTKIPFSVAKDAIIRSDNEIYKTMHVLNVTDIKLDHYEIIFRHNQYYLDLKLSGDFRKSTTLSIYLSNILINNIFENQVEIKISNDITLSINRVHDIFSLPYYSFHTIQLYLPSSPLNHIKISLPLASYVDISMEKILLNTVIVCNSFLSNILVAQLSSNEIIRVLSVKDKSGILIPHRLHKENGWFVEFVNGQIKINHSEAFYAETICKNSYVTGKSCTFDEFSPGIPRWTILPIDNDYKNFKNFMNFLQCNVSEPSKQLHLLIKYWNEKSSDKIYLTDISIEEIILRKSIKNHVVSVIGYKLILESNTRDFLLLEYIKKFMQQYNEIELWLQNNGGLWQIH